MTNSADPDQLASEEANWSRSTLFAKTGHVVFSKRRVKHTSRTSSSWQEEPWSIKHTSICNKSQKYPMADHTPRVRKITAVLELSVSFTFWNIILKIILDSFQPQTKEITRQTGFRARRITEQIFNLRHPDKKHLRYKHLSLRNHVYSNILNTLPPKNENFQIKQFWYSAYFCSKHRLWVLVRTASPRRF